MVFFIKNIAESTVRHSLLRLLNLNNKWFYTNFSIYHIKRKMKNQKDINIIRCI